MRDNCIAGWIGLDSNHDCEGIPATRQQHPETDRLSANLGDPAVGVGCLSILYSTSL